MKTLFKQTMLCLSLLAASPLTGGAQEAVGGNRSGQEVKRELPNPERDARRQTDKLKTALGLTDKQYEKIYKLNLKEQKEMLNSTRQGNSQNMPMGGPMGGMGGMSGGGPGGMPGGMGGMNPPMGPPPGGGAPGNFKPSSDMQDKMKTRDKKMKKILTAEQYEKWKAMKPERPEGRPDRSGGNFPGSQAKQ